MAIYLYITKNDNSDVKEKVKMQPIYHFLDILLDFSNSFVYFGYLKNLNIMPTSVKTILNNKKIKSILSVLPSVTVFEALEVMSQYNIGALLVMEGDKLVGIFSERDYARKGIVQGRSAKSTVIADVMTPNVYTVESKMTSKDCMEIMNARKFRHLPVVDDGKVMGVLSVGDIVSTILDEQKEHIKYLESYIVNG